MEHDLRQAAPEACKHDQILTWTTGDGEPALWACASCSRKFEPVAALSAIEAVQEKGEKGNLVHLAAPFEAIGSMLNECMDRAVANGANSVSMPDEYVAVAAWLAGIPAAQWQPIETAPKDGTRVLLWVVHTNAKFAKDPVAERWAAECIGEWLDFNGGGWSWHGHSGAVTHWMPLPAPPVADPGQAGKGETK